MLEEFLHAPRVAYFSMEIALRSDIPTYTGGLGILAGDTMRSAADLALPLVAVSLVSRAGHFRQKIDGEGRQVEGASPWEPARWARLLNARVAVPIESRQVWIGAWLYLLEGQTGGRQPVLLLDSALEDNEPQDRDITSALYGGDDVLRLKQEIVLGIGGMRMLQALGFEISQYHMNEGHSALLGLELLRRFAYSPGELRPGESLYNLPAVRRRCCFTTHTPVEAGHDRFPYDIVRRILPLADSGQTPTSEQVIDLPLLRQLGGQDELNMTRLALNLSDYVNGVAKRHAELSERMFPGYHVHAISNGVHPLTWTCESFRRLYDRYLPGWCHEPELLMRADCCIPDAAILDAHVQAKRELIDRVRALKGVTMRPEIPIFGFARRMTAYKRPDLLFSDLARLKAIARSRAFQIVLAGKAHPRDADGKRLIAELHGYVRSLADSLAIVYLADYDMAMAQLLVAGTDVWLNTPLPPQEASGTSGMKAALNGVPSLSVLDGWWIDGCIEGVTGWAIGSGGRGDGDAEALYDKLERIVLPLYYGDSRDGRGWIQVMKGAISKNGSYFSSHRMMRRYATEAYSG
ncbi:MAG TPA: alpha-glucan family phosphorylase [Steroidobacteraceae bacterium]|nr:alpha-glucan family phosphorylase [Steroidobacteraceae bacterium]